MSPDRCLININALKGAEQSKAEPNGTAESPRVPLEKHYYGGVGTTIEWRQCRWCGGYAEGPIGSQPARHVAKEGVMCPLATFVRATESIQQLRSYVQHKDECLLTRDGYLWALADMSRDTPIERVCTCGLDDVLKAIGGK